MLSSLYDFIFSFITMPHALSIFSKRGLLLACFLFCSGQSYAKPFKGTFRPFQFSDTNTSQLTIATCREELVSVIKAFRARKKPEEFGGRLLFAEAFSSFLYNWGELRRLHQEFALNKYYILRQETLPFYLKKVAADLEILQDLLNTYLDEDGTVWSVLTQYSEADAKNILMLILGNPEWCAYFEQNILQAVSYWTLKALRGRKSFTDYQRWIALGAAMAPIFERLRSTEDYYLRQVNGAAIIEALRAEDEEANAGVIAEQLLLLTTMPLLQGYGTLLPAYFPPALVNLGRWGGDVGGHCF